MNNRSYLMVGAHKQKHLDKLPILKCDTAIINLEDGVYDKQYALELLKQNFANKSMRYKNKEVVVRINSLDTLGVKEIEVINQLKPNAIRVPKIRSIQDIQLAIKLIDSSIDIHLSIETKEAFSNLKNLKIDKRVTTVYLGILDLLESLKLPQTLLKLDNPTIDHLLSRFLIDSKIAGFNPVSFIYQDYKNIDQFTKWCQKEKSMGFEAKGCISPAQVDIINDIFNTNKEEIEKAKYIVKVFQEHQARSISGFSDEKYGFIDEPIYKDALLLLNKQL